MLTITQIDLIALSNQVAIDTASIECEVPLWAPYTTLIFAINRHILP
jgi:hypothetical protein